MSVSADVAAAIPFLPNVCIEYHPEEFVADKVLSSALVPTYSGTYTTFSSDTAFQIYDDTMAPGARANEINWKSSLDSYIAAPHGVSDHYDYDASALNPVAVNWAMVKTQNLARILKTNKELAVIALCKAATTYKTKTLGGYEWWTSAGVYNSNAYPIKDVQNLRTKTAMPPNFIVMGRDVFISLQNHPNVVGQRPVNRAGSINPAEMAELFDVKEIIVSDLKYNNAGNRGRTQTLGYAWSGVFFLGYRYPDEFLGIDQITWAAQFLVDNEDTSDGPHVSQVMAKKDGWLIRAWEDPTRGVSGGLSLGAFHKYALKVVAYDLGCLLDMTSTS